ncbi:MAG: glycosyltransferase [Eubacterium sp.]|nr:glycosyltransferase [Eubacterium sp.]
MPKYSFIIPVYNSEKYLSACINSILEQTYTNFEILLIDDGSKDDSGSICDQYAKDYACISAFHKENGGASSARNMGTDKAKGEYIIFLDSDDYWDSKDGLKEIDSLITDEVDVVVFASKNTYENERGEITSQKNDRYDYPDILNTLSPIEALEFMVKNDLLNMHSSKKVYRKRFYTDNNLYFKEGIRAEDIEQGFRVANCLPVYRFLNQKLYVYRHHSGSVTATIGENHLMEYYWIIKKYSNFHFMNERIANCLNSYLAYQYALLLAFITRAKMKNKKKILRELKKYQYLFRYDMYPRTRIISRVNRILGYNITRILLRLYLKSR